jgi:hypothetical protein
VLPDSIHKSSQRESDRSPRLLSETKNQENKAVFNGLKIGAHSRLLEHLSTHDTHAEFAAKQKGKACHEKEPKPILGQLQR